MYDWNYYGHFNNFDDFGFPFSSHAGPNRSDSKRQASVDSTNGYVLVPNRKRPRSFYGGAVYHDANYYHVNKRFKYDQKKRHEALNEADREFIRDQHPYDPVGKSLAVGTAVANRVSRWLEPKTIKGQGAPSVLRKKKIVMANNSRKGKGKRTYSNYMGTPKTTPQKGYPGRSVPMSRNPRSLRYLAANAYAKSNASGPSKYPRRVGFNDPMSRITYRAIGKTQGMKRKKRRGAKKIKYKYNGAITTYEDGWTSTSTQCAYTGAGASINRISLSMMRALCSSVAKILKIEIRSWDGLCSIYGSYLIEFRYVADASSLLAATSTTITQATTTWNVLADQMLAMFRTLIGPGSVPWAGQFVEILVSEGTTPVFVRGSIKLDTYYFDLDYTVKLKIQNQTPADTAGTVVQTDVVNANPLDCRVYYTHDTKFFHKGSDALPSPVYVFETAEVSGAIIKPWAAGSALPKELIKPAAPSFFTAVKDSSKFKMMPGQITYKKINRKHTVAFNRALNYLATVLDSAVTTAAGVKMFGASILIGAEKAMDNRQNTAQITLGIQCDSTYKCASHQGKNRGSIPQNFVTLTAVPSL